ncbi:hypothetical protein [Burkholderia sp. Ac-20353]|uniref:hypothetical protein n=1 Tax=Burkholderia sp. Ac-20353 TaxID=2703894 RepID=UPI001F11A1D5|nr:hypothetical protein [Burkholderia sp. Ac-20353]
MIRDAIAEASESGGTAINKLAAAMRRYAESVTMDFGKCVICGGEEPLPLDRRRTLRRLKAEIDHEFRHLIELAIAEGTRNCQPIPIK